MEANFNIPQTYAILVAIDNSVGSIDLSTLISKFTDLNKLAVEKNEDTYILKSTSPTERYIRFYIGIGDKVDKSVKDELIKATTGQLYLPNARFIWFSGQDYSKEQIVIWLTKLANQDNCAKIWVVDSKTDLTGALLSKFGDI